MSFTKYHATPMSNVLNIMKYGLEPRPAPHKTMFTSTEKIVYLMSSIGIARDYADHLYKIRKSNAKAWGILKIEYDEFPDEVYQDLDWKLPGIYYVKRWIEPEHITFVERYFVNYLYLRRVKKT